MHGSLGPPESPPKRHLDRFNRFCMAHERGQLTDSQTDHATPSAAIDRIYPLLRCGIKIQNFNGR